MADPVLEAAAGAVGSLMTCVLLYPVETAKTRIQTGKSNEGTAATIRAIARDDGTDALFKGLPLKSLHVVLNNYVYFYLYEILKAQRRAIGMRTSTLSNTICGVLAGVGNLTLTLPLDTLVVQLQSSDGKSKSIADLAAALAAKGRRGVYRGFGVSCILTLNPALTFAVFDAIKARICKVLKTKRLTMLQAFVLGSIAKAIATVLTYPLIRTKTVIQRGGKVAAQQQSRGEQPSDATTLVAHEPGMLQVMRDIMRTEGVEGLYRGCSAQIFTAVCKSGILLTTKEKVAAFAMALLLLAGRRRGPTGSPAKS